MQNKLKEYDNQINSGIHNKLLLNIETELENLNKLELMLGSNLEIKNREDEILEVCNTLFDETKFQYNTNFIKDNSKYTEKKILLILDLLEKLTKDVKKDKKLREKYPDIKAKISKNKFFFMNNKKNLISNVFIVKGQGATGKTHLLTKFNKSILEKGNYSIIFYGAKIVDFNQLLLNLKKYFGYEDFFLQLSEEAEKNKKTPLIIVDAINEINLNEQKNFLKEIAKKAKENNIKLIFSYRNDDVDINLESKFKKVSVIETFGFDNEYAAAYKFAEKFNIDVNDLLQIDFNNNPLMMKLYCEIYIEEGPLVGNVSSTNILENYFKLVSKKIIIDKQIKRKNGELLKHDDFWISIAKKTAKIFVKEKRNFITENEFHSIIKELNLDIEAKEITKYLVSYNLFQRNEYDGVYEYKLSFQKFSDFLITRYLMNEKPTKVSWKEYFNTQEMLDYLIMNPSILISLTEEIPIRLKGTELFELINITNNEYFLESYFKGLSFRSRDSFHNEYEFMLKFNKFVEENQLNLHDNNEFIMMLGYSTLFDYHPFNFQKITKEKLFSYIKNRRELKFQSFFNVNKERILSFSKFPYTTSNKQYSSKIINLALLLLYSLGSANREIRDKSTKSLFVLLDANLDLITLLLNESILIEDQYIIERTLVIIDGLLAVNELEDRYNNKIIQYLESKYKNQNLSNIRISYYLERIIEKINKKGYQIDRDLFNKNKLEEINITKINDREFDIKEIDSTKIPFVLGKHNDFYKKIAYYNSDKFTFELKSKENNKKLESFLIWLTNNEYIVRENIIENLIIQNLFSRMVKYGYNESIKNIDNNSGNLFYNKTNNSSISEKFVSIATYELLGELNETFQLKSYHDFIDVLDIDIDVLQSKNHRDEVDEFYKEFIKQSNVNNIEFNKEDFVNNFDNLNIFNDFYKIEYNDKDFVPLFLSIKHENLNKEKNVFCRISLHKGNTKEIQDLLSSNYQMSSVYNELLEDVYEGKDEHRKSEETQNERFIHLAKKVYLENEYDYSNINITKDDRNRIYFLPRKELIENSKYYYDGAIYNQDNEVIAIQSPFDREIQYLYLCKELLKDKGFTMYFKVYSEKEKFPKEYKTNFEGYERGSEFDAVYTLENGVIINKKIKKR